VIAGISTRANGRENRLRLPILGASPATFLCVGTNLIIAAITLLTAKPAVAACDNHTPTAGQTTACNPPTTDTTGVAAVAGSTNVTVNVLSGAQINVANINGVFVRDQSSVVNQGGISVSGDTFDGITSDQTGNNNTLINRGTITTSGAFSEGIFTTGTGSMLLNDSGGTITTSGHDSPGLHSFGGLGGNILTNSGTITGTGGILACRAGCRRALRVHPVSRQH
jgi:hypothetical protein